MFFFKKIFGEKEPSVNEKKRPVNCSFECDKRSIIRDNSGWQKLSIRNWSIGKKFGYSYMLAIAIAIVGTTVGLAVGEYYQKQALQALTETEEQQELLHELEKSILAMRSHPQRLVPTLGKTVWFDYEKATFLGNVRQVDTWLSELFQYIDERPNRLATNQVNYRQLLRDYQQATDSYVTQILSLWNRVEPATVQADEIRGAQQKILTLLNGESYTTVSAKFDRLSEQLNELINDSGRQYEEATIYFQKSRYLRLQIIAFSMILSTAIATFLAVYTSRAIATPIKSVTTVANRVVKESNFYLQAPVTTADEAGLLAMSLNQLIRWVREYTEALEFARRTLEERVDERTRELKLAVEELKQTQSQLIQTEKMSGLGQMVAGIAHEINNPVSFIYGNTEHAKEYAQDLLNLVQLYQESYPDPKPEIVEMMEEIDFEFMKDDFIKLMTSIRVGADRIREIVLSLRNFSRLDEADMKDVNLHDGIDSTLLLLNNRLNHRIEIVKSYGDLPLVKCYPAQLNQVFMNIIANAIDALEDFYKKEPDRPPKIFIETEQIGDREVEVKIRDNGPGIPPEIRNKLFDPFFTTKEIGKGTGLGLSICYQIVEKHRGKIILDSQVSRGTTFCIQLPTQ
ncbi:ATP-binding protein [Lyngbya sp. CCY1209]|uniref:sensor histidine kinase n=1 Tax=Lyngbya sp. CCY1209 TaxID=2886103 RepID=UPI002D210842|nr:ATP-binding protein [Lyngbya sp. CCY1209]MEB3885777.1 HAMP domain-containing protein [Lyngbya sp. CCY1209]